MIVEKLYTNGNSSIEKHDKEIIKFLVEHYGAEELINNMNDLDFQAVNEVRKDLNFNRTGGARVRGVSGLLQSIPSFLITAAISWPTALLAGLGALSYRIQKNYEDPKSIANRLNPRFWVDWLANPYRDKKSYSSSSYRSKDGSTFWDKTKDYLGIGAAAGTGAAAGAVIANKDDDEDERTPEEIKNEDFKEYWFTLSNDEIIRVRADNEEHATMMVNLIIAYSKKTYEMLNAKISEDCPRYTFYFNDGEKCYWSALTKNQAYKEALETRKDLTKILNKPFKGLIVLDDLSIPEVDGEVEVSRIEKIPYPEQDKFKEITTTQPRRESGDGKKLPHPVYQYEDIEHYRIHHDLTTFNIPATSDREAIEILRKLERNNEILEKMYFDMEKKLDVFKVVMADGDIYHIPGSFIDDVKEMARDLWNMKIKAIEETLSGDIKDQFTRYMDEYGTLLRKFRNISQLKKKTLTWKKGDEGRIKKITGDDNPEEKGEKFKLEA